MGVFLRVFDPKGFRNNYTGTNWRKVEGPTDTPVEAVQKIRAHRIRQEEKWATIPAKQEKMAEEEPEPDEPVEFTETTLQKAKPMTPIEKDIVAKKEFYGPGEITGMAIDMMFECPATIKWDATVGEAVKILKKNNVVHLPVVTEENRICGLLTEEQIFRHGVENKLKPEEVEETKVAELMISPVLCCVNQSPIQAIFLAFLEGGVGYLPVVDQQDHLLGVVTKTSMLQYIYDSNQFFH